MSEIALILLAAGGSTRMGAPKQLLPYGSGTLMDHMVQTALATPCRPVVVVLGADADRIRPEAARWPVQIVENPDWAQGLGSSIRAGLAAVVAIPAVEAVILMLGDQPLVSAEVLENLIETHRHTGADLVASEYGGTLGVPALFGRRFFPELAALPDSQGAKRLFTAHADAVVRVPFPEGVVDVDTPEDYRKIMDSAGS